MADVSRETVSERRDDYPWSDDDIALLTKGRDEGKRHRVLAEELGRSFNAVRTKAHRLGITQKYRRHRP